MIKRLKDGTTYEPVGYLTVAAMDARAACRFFGLDPDTARAVDVGPAEPPERYKPGARTFHVYRSAAELPS
jgi:hypothetical protein